MLLLARFEKRDLLIGAIVIGSLVADHAAVPRHRRAVAGTGSRARRRTLRGELSWNGGLITVLFISFRAMAADAADEHDLRLRASRGAVFRRPDLHRQRALGVGTLLGLALDLIGFPTDLASHPEQTLPADVVRHLGTSSDPPPGWWRSPRPRRFCHTAWTAGSMRGYATSSRSALPAATLPRSVPRIRVAGS